MAGPGSPDIVEIVKTVETASVEVVKTVVKAVEKTVEKIEKTVETSVRTLVTDTRPSRAARTLGAWDLVAVGSEAAVAWHH